jgi:hypothetical protein
VNPAFLVDPWFRLLSPETPSFKFYIEAVCLTAPTVSKTNPTMCERSTTADIAVIGLSCRFPGDAKSPDEFFDLLLKGGSSWTEVPKERFNINAYWHPSHDRHGSMVGRGGHFLSDDVGLFDAPVSRKFIFTNK